MAGSSVIQWNCRGFNANYNELRVLSQQLNPLAICLQETYIKEKKKMNFKNYTMYNVNAPDGDRAAGGSAILVRRDIIHSEIKIKTKLQAVAVRLSFLKTISFCSIYIPPGYKLAAQELHNLADQLPSPYMLMGDFNSHNPIWGGNKLDEKGKTVEDFIAGRALCILNDGSHTYLHPGYGTYSAIDLTIADPELLLDSKWSVWEDLCGSDHFPIVVRYDTPQKGDREQRWRLKKADWHSFRALCNQSFTAEETADPDAIGHFTSTILSIADKAVPKTSTSPKCITNPWYDDDCKKAIKERKKALRKFNRYPTAENLNTFKILRARARKILKEKQRTCWRHYVSSINAHTPITKIWGMIKKIKGKGESCKIQHIKENGSWLTCPQDIANKLAATFERNSSINNCCPTFQTFKACQEKNQLKFKSNNKENYNQLFTLEEIKRSLSKSHDTAVGPDKIHYQFLKNLPEPILGKLLNIFNNIWKTGKIPASWQEATIIPVPKPGKDHTDPNNYRPIALTSCVCKTMERMVNDRLVWQLESEHHLTDFQCGFRRGRSTLDHLIRLESFIRNAFIRREHVVAVFFDLEKAYDTTWKYGIMKDLHEMGFRGRLPIFIANFLTNRHFRVRINTTLSDVHKQELGVPQGSILSVTLFSIKINGIANSIPRGMPCSLYVDDFLIYYRGKNMNVIERQLQLCLNKLHSWSVQNGFRFSKAKTVCMHFCQLRTMHNDPELKINGDSINVVKETRFLGLIFDSKLSFLPHIRALRAKCLRALDVMKVLASTEWGADSTVLLQIYRTLIRSKLDYGSIVYGSARMSYLRQLNTVHHQGLRLALGAFRTSPVQSLYVEGKEPSLQNRRLKLSLQYAVKLRTNPSNPAYKCVFSPEFERLYEARPSYIRPLGLRIKPHLADLGADLKCLAQSHVSDIPPWQLKRPKIILRLAESRKSETHPIRYRDEFFSVRSEFPSHVAIYTDGSKDDSRVAAAAVVRGRSFSTRLPDQSSIFTAEARALLLALEYVEASTGREFILFSDSRSCLEALSHLKTDHPIITRILSRLRSLEMAECDIRFCWIPGHVGISGNEQADMAAKKALDKNIEPCLIPHSDLRPAIHKYVTRKWQSEWDECPNNKLHRITPSVGEVRSSSLKSRRDQVILTRCRIGHSRLTHGHLLKGELAPECIPCQCPLTLRHVLVECTDFSHIRPNFYRKTSLRSLFRDVKEELILAFIKATGLYTHL